MVEAPYPLIPVPAKKDWLDEHPHRRILVGGLILIGCMGLFVSGVLSLVEYSFHHHTVTRQSFERAANDPRVIQVLGQPIRMGWVIKGNVHMKDANGYADLRIPISGPKGEATIFLYARETFGAWEFRILRVEMPGATAIDLR